MIAIRLNKRDFSNETGTLRYFYEYNYIDINFI